MSKNIWSLLSLVAMIFVSPLASSATVALDPNSLSITPNQTFTVDLVLNVDPNTEFGIGPADAAYSGDVIISFDSSDVTFDNFAIDAAQTGGLITELASAAGSYSLRFSGIAFADNDGGVIGSYSFTGNNLSGLSQLTIDDANAGGSFVMTAFGSALQSFDPTEFTGATVSAVPVPAAVWLLLSGLGALGFIARRRAA